MGDRPFRRAMLPVEERLVMYVIWFRMAVWAPGTELSVTADILEQAQELWDVLNSANTVMLSARP